MDEALCATLQALEERLLQTKVRRSTEEMEALIDPAFVEFGASGQVYDRDAIVAALAGEAECSLRLQNFAVRELAPGVALATYQSHRTGSGGAREALRCSVWVKGEFGWQMVFHQGTLVKEQGL